MNIRLLLMIIAMPFIAVISGSAQSTTFDQYRKDAGTLDITLSVPDGFEPVIFPRSYSLPITQSTPPKDEISLYWAYPVAIKSTKKDVCMMYPVILADKPMIGLGKVVENEIRAAKNDKKLNITGYISFVSDNDLLQKVNADTIIIYDLDLKGSLMNAYNHCVGILIRKYAHQTLLLKIGFTDNSYLIKDKIIKELLGSIRYGNELQEKLIEREKRIGKNLDFPNKEVWNTGILVTCKTQIEMENNEIHPDQSESHKLHHRN